MGLLIWPWITAWTPGPLYHLFPLLQSGACLGLLWLLGLRPKVDQLALAWVLAALFNALVGLLQYAGWAHWGGGLLYEPAVLGEAMGQLRQRNQLASLLAIGTLALIWGQAHAGWRLRWVWPSLLLLSLGLAATGSRTGLLHSGLIVALTLWWWRRGGASAWAPLLAGAGLLLHVGFSLSLPALLLALGGPDVSGALARMGQMQGCGSRQVLWGNVWHLILQQPWTGWGPDALKGAHYLANYPGERFCDILGNAHNLWLHLAFVAGLPAAGLALVLLLAALWRLRPWQARAPAALLGWAVLAIVGLHSLLEFPLWYGPFQIATLLALGLVIWGQAMPGPLGAWRVAGLALLLLCAHVAQDYVRVRQVFVPSEQRLVWGGVPAWSRASQTVWFQDTYRFAAYITREVSAENAAWMLQEGQALLHYSPEPRVIDRILCSAALLGRQDVLDLHGPRRQIALAIERRTPVQAAEVPLAACPAS
jgi:O-antigen ligase